MRRVSAASGFEIIDDAYNANPGSVSASLTTVSSLADGRTWSCILGDMLELGDKAKTYHREIGRIAGGSGATEVWAIGEFAELVAEGARSQGSEVQIFKSTDSALEYVSANNRPKGELILLKGSRGNRLEKLIPGLEVQ